MLKNSLVHKRLTKTALLCLAVLVMISFSCRRENLQFTVSIESNGLHYPVRLHRLDTNGIKPLDSLVKPAEGSFNFVIDAKQPFVYIIESGNNREEFIAASGDVIKVDFSAKKIIEYPKHQFEKFNSFLEEKKDIERKADSLAIIFNEAQVTDSFPQVRDRLNESFMDLLFKYRITASHFIYTDTSVAIFSALMSTLKQSVVLNYVVNRQLFQHADSVLNLKYPEHPYTVWLNNYLAFNKAKYGILPESKADLRQGMDFPLVSLPGLNNKTTEIRPLKGETALVYFWNEDQASRKATAAVKRIEDKYKGKGLKIYAIAFTDKRTNWSSLIELNKMWWTNMIDERSSGSPLLSQLSVGRLPYFFVVNDNRKVIASFGSAEELDEWVITFFSK